LPLIATHIASHLAQKTSSNLVAAASAAQTYQTKIKPNLTLVKPKKWQRCLPSIKKSAFICAIHPILYCCGGRVCGSNSAFKIEEQSQKIRNRSSNSIKPNQGLFCQKNSEFFSGHFRGKSLANIGKIPKKTPQITPKTCNL